MKIRVTNKQNEVLYEQALEPETDLNKLISFLTQLPVGDARNVVVTSNGHPMSFLLGSEWPLGNLVKTANGIKVRQ